MVYFTLRFLSLVDLHLLPVYIIICFVLIIPIWNPYILCLNFMDIFRCCKNDKATYLPLQLCLCMLFRKIVLFTKKWACFNKRFHCWVAIEAVICSSFIESCAINAIVSKPQKCIHLAVKDLPFLSCLNLVILCNSSNTKLHVLHFHLSGLLQFYNMQVTEKNLWQYWLLFSI